MKENEHTNGDGIKEEDSADDINGTEDAQPDNTSVTPSEKRPGAKLSFDDDDLKLDDFPNIKKPDSPALPAELKRKIGCKAYLKEDIPINLRAAGLVGIAVMVLRKDTIGTIMAVGETLGKIQLWLVQIPISREIDIKFLLPEKWLDIRE